MPVIISPQYDNPEIGQIVSNLGTAIFGSAQDRANRDLRMAQMGNYNAEASLNRAKADRWGLANSAAGKIGDLQAALVRQPNESDYDYLTRTAPARGQMMLLGADSSAKDISEAGGNYIGQGYIQGGGTPGVRLGLDVMGKPAKADDAVTAAEGDTIRQAALTKATTEANIKAAADRAVAGIQAATARRGQDLEHQDRTYRTDREFGKNGKPLIVSDNQTVYPTTADGGFDFQHPILPAGGARNAVKALSPAEAGAIDAGVWRQYPGATTQNKKTGATIISPDVNAAANLSPESIANARSIGQAAYMKSGRLQDGIDAMTKALGIPVGTTLVPGSSGFFGIGKSGPRFDYTPGGSFQAATGGDTGAPAAPPPPTGPKPQPPAPASLLPVSAAPPMPTAAPSAPLTLAKPAPAVSSPIVSAVTDVPLTVPTTATAAPAKPAAKPAATNYSTQTESVTVRPDRTAPPVPNIAPPVAPKATMPVIAQAVTQAPAQPKPAPQMTEAQARQLATTDPDPKVRAYWRDRLGMPPEPAAAPAAPTFTDKISAMRASSDPNPVVRRAAADFLNTGISPIQEAAAPEAPSVFTNQQDASRAVQSSDPIQRAEAAKFFRQLQQRSYAKAPPVADVVQNKSQLPPKDQRVNGQVIVTPKYGPVKYNARTDTWHPVPMQGG